MNLPDEIEQILKEYNKQDEMWGAQHDQEHTEKELVRAAIAYLRLYTSETLGDREVAKSYWPWTDHWKPKTPRDVLRVAAAFIASEMRRIK